MKTFSILLTSGLWLLASVCSAADLTLTDGRVLKEAKITSQSATSVTVRHAGGFASVPKAQLPESLRAQYQVAQQESGIRSQESGEQKAARIAKMRADEQARIAKVKTERADREEWLKVNREKVMHDVEYVVHGWVPYCDITYEPANGSTSQKRIKPQGEWTEKFTALDGKFLYLHVTLPSIAAETEISIKVDGVVVQSTTINSSYGNGIISYRLGGSAETETSSDTETPRHRPASETGPAMTDVKGNSSITIPNHNPDFRWQ